MKRLHKVCAVWNDLDKSYENDSEKRLAHSKPQITRLDFLAKLVRYTGTIDDITKFKAIFSNEIKSYTDDELVQYNQLIENVQEILEILSYCKPAEKEKKLFEISDDLTINEIREVVKAYKSEALKTLDNMDLFGDAGDADDVDNAGDAGEQLSASKIAAVAPFNAHDYYITKSKVTCLPTDLFSKGKLSNYFESVDGEIRYMCAPSICNEYVYIDDKASFLNYLYYASNNLSSINGFKKAVYTFLTEMYALAKKQKVRFKFPYVFISTDLVTETKACYKVGELTFRKNKIACLDLKNKGLTDLFKRSFINTEEVYLLETTNSGITYQVVLVGNLG